jgi:predicted ATPase
VNSGGYDVFICHAFEDADHARAICSSLEENGVRCWLAPRDPVPGIPYGRQIVDAIEGARLLLLIFTSHANQSRAVINEVELASSSGKVIIPVRVEDVTPSKDLAFYVSAVHWFDAFGVDLKEEPSALLRHVSSFLGQEPRLKAPAQPARLRQAKSSENNLPLQVTSFYGREDDIREIKGLLPDHHLVTILGAGGVGKTRLAIQAGTELLDEFEDGVWIGDLAPINEPQLVAKVVAQALGVNQSEGLLDNDSIARWLKHKRLLLILDNCEHLLDPAARLVDAIDRQCSQVRIMVTSRQALGVSGEKVFRLSSLAVPEPPRDRIPDAAILFSAVALFVDRACLADRAFKFQRENSPIVVAICRRLDGIPLAIELAAARLRMMSVSGLAQRLDERFKILTGGSRTALPRQQTLRALIDWSYDLLQTEERCLFERLAVFAGAFTLDAAAHVCSGDGIEAADALSLLCSLADKSLVVIETQSDEERYYLLETTRDYAYEKLTAAESCEPYKRRYADYYHKVAIDFERCSAVMELGAWLTRVRRDLQHFRAVMEWSISERNEIVLGASLAAALEAFWWHGGVEAEGRYWIDAASAGLDTAAHPEVTARLAQAQARLASRILFS